MIWKIFIIKITIKSCPTLSVPYSAILLKDKLKNINAKIYKNFRSSLVVFETISLNKKKLKKIKKNNKEKWKE